MRKYIWLLLLGLYMQAYGQIRSARSSSAVVVSPDGQDRVAATFPVVDKIFMDLAKKHHYPGLAFGIVKDNKLVYVGQTGFSNLEEKTPVSGQSLFRIASMTKSFVAMAMMMLRDQGKLNLDDHVSLYVPELADSRLLTHDAPAITIRHLLTHSAGFPEDNPWGDRQMADTEAEFTQLLTAGLSLSTAPGTGYEYSNLGFALLGRVISRISGLPYQQFIIEKILRPLHMKNTIWEYDQAPAGRLALGYNLVNEQWIAEPMLHDGSFGAIGGLITSVEDFSQYLALHISAWPARDGIEDGPLSRASLREMQQCWRVINLDDDFTDGAGRPCPVVNGYGFGLRYVRDCRNHVFVGHSGGLPGFGSHWRMLPEYGIGVVVFANQTYADLGKSCYAALDTMITLAGLQPRRIPASSILEKRAQELVRCFPDWKVASRDSFAENFFLDFPIDSLRKQSGRLYSHAGKVVKVAEVVPRNQLRGALTLQCEKADIEIFFTLSPENPARIQYIEFKEISHRE